MPKLIVSGEMYIVASGVTIEEAVSKEGMHPDSYLYMINGKPVPMDTVLTDESEVKVLRVASGG